MFVNKALMKLLYQTLNKQWECNRARTRSTALVYNFSFPWLPWRSSKYAPIHFLQIMLADLSCKLVRVFGNRRPKLCCSWTALGPCTGRMGRTHATNHLPSAVSKQESSRASSRQVKGWLYLEFWELCFAFWSSFSSQVGDAYHGIVVSCIADTFSSNPESRKYQIAHFPRKSIEMGGLDKTIWVCLWRGQLRRKVGCNTEAYCAANTWYRSWWKPSP